MGVKNSNQSMTTFVSLKAKTSDTDPSPYFGKNEKKGDAWEITEKFNSVDGHLRDIGYKSYEYEGQTKYKCVMKLVDPDGSVTQLETGFNNLLYGILNSMRGSKLDFIEIQVWLGKAKEVGAKRYPSGKVLNNGTQLEWQVAHDQLPRPEKIKVKNTVVMDDSEVIEYWKKVIDNEIKPNLSKDPVVQERSGEMPPNANTGKSEAEYEHTAADAPPSDEEENLPF